MTHEERAAMFVQIIALATTLAKDISISIENRTDSVDFVQDAALEEILSVIERMCLSIMHIDTMRKHTNQYPVIPLQ
jgi:hypothetical protein